jgi:hypothetical protein
LIAGEVVQFFVYCIHPILKSFIYILRLNARDKIVMFNKRSKLLRSSHYTICRTPYDEILWMCLK